MTENFSGYVLAGGKSSRMKTDKAFLNFNGETFLERAFNLLTTVCDERVKIIINPNQTAKYENSFPSFDFVRDIFFERGAVGGIHAALKDCKTEWAIILACDLPIVTGEAIKNMLKFATSEEIAAVVPKQSDGKLQPLCAAYRVKNCLPELEKLLLEKTSVSVRDFLEKVSVQITEQKDLSTDHKLFLNVNSPADFESIDQS